MFSVVDFSTLTIFFIGLSPVLCLILFAESIYLFKLGYKVLAKIFLFLAILLGVPTLIITNVLSA